MYTRVHSISSSNEVQRQLLALIREGRLAVNDRLPAERELAAMLGVSRATLREALRGLSDRGVVEARQGDGWYVKPNADALIQNMAVHLRFDDFTFPQLAEARNVLEPSIAALAAANRTSEEVRELTSIATSMESEEDSMKFIQLDSKFHEVLARATRNPFFVLAVKPILVVLDETREQVVREADARRQIAAEHRAIALAVEVGDSRRARSAMEDHLRSFVNRRHDKARVVPQGGVQFDGNE